MAQGVGDALAAKLAAYHDQLVAAERRGPTALAEAFASPPPGLAAHEIDAEMRVLRANDADLALLGYAREEFVGRRVLDSCAR